MTVFPRNSSSVLTGMPMSDELQPCCTFMSSGREAAPRMSLVVGWSLLLLSSRRREEPMSCVAPCCALANTPSSKQARRCKNQPFPAPLPLVKDRNQFSSLLPPFLLGSRLIGSLKSYLIQIPCRALKRSVRDSVSATRHLQNTPERARLPFTPLLPIPDYFLQTHSREWCSGQLLSL